ncbi:MAG TPA: DUF6629 family protein, partial [Flavobacteriales bacterium]|nr:DUF6629 family protein [Flavobacteriales bacterium]
MCFSAGTSFGVGIVLTTTGVATLKKANERSQFAFACIPLIFGIQQISEGFVWLSLQNPAFSEWQTVSTYIFLAFAQVVWPAWVPLSFLLLERQKKPKSILYGLTGIGLLVAGYLAYRLATNVVTSHIVGMHIWYDLGIEGGVVRVLGILYFVATVVPPFFSSLNRMWLLGTFILASYIITKLFFEEYVISVWCFFAALISVTVF